MKPTTFCSYLAVFSPLIFGVLKFYGIYVPPELIELVCPAVAAGGATALHVKASPLGK